jgi:hypothetical protein
MDDLIQRVYRNFSTAPLDAQSELYVELDSARGNEHLVGRLERRIQLADNPTCQVLAGHKGSGKSTELRRLQKKLESGGKKFFTVLCEADRDIDRNDVDFPDVLTAIVRQLAHILRERVGIQLAPGYFASRFSQLKKLLGSEVSFENLDLDAGLLKLSTSIKNSPEARQEIRKLLEPDTGNWIYAPNDVIGKAIQELNKIGYAGLAIIVDDLDKIVLRPCGESGCTTHEHLFVNRAAQLKAFQCHVVYTMPIELAYSCAEAEIRAVYDGDPPVIPMIKIQSKPPERKPYQAGRKLLERVIHARLNNASATVDQVFSGDSMARLIELSGGQLTELMSLVRESIVTNGLPINDQSLARASREGQKAYARQFRDNHWPIIEEVRACGAFQKTTGNEEAVRELLESRAILLYVNDEEWYDLNPLVKEIPAPPGRKGNAS